MCGNGPELVQPWPSRRSLTHVTAPLPISRARAAAATSVQAVVVPPVHEPVACAFSRASAVTPSVRAGIGQRRPTSNSTSSSRLGYLAWDGVAWIGAAAALVLARGEGMRALVLAAFLGSPPPVVTARRFLPLPFGLLFVLASVLGAVG